MNVKNIIYNSILAVVSFFLPSCVDDFSTPGNDSVEEGLPATISLKVDLPDMDRATRSDMESGTDTQVNSLWLGIFSSTTGKCNYAGYVSKTLNQEHDPFITIEKIPTLSGGCYIVAVGNPVDNYGYDSNGNRKDLGEMLPESTEKANSLNFTWDTYNQLSVSQLSPGKIDTPVGNLVMSGIYSSSEDDSKIGDWEEANYTPVYIEPGSSKLTGAIHLRRLISKVKFNIKASKSTKKGIKVLDVTPQSYKVYNVPVISSLHEQKTSGSRTNAGDFVKIPGVVYDVDASLPFKANYPSSSLYSGKQYITKVMNQGSEVYTFDFWALENKRMAVKEIPSTEEGYHMREKEWKIYTGETDDNDKDIVKNTGIYTALCGESGEETMNNCATYVEIRCRLEYTEDGLVDLNEREHNNTAETTIERRTAEAVYVVHLGGIGSNWKDFCHRRNHKYTYNITVVDLENILVEAESDEEVTPGAEGVVTDVTNPPFELDAHYGVFNIHLTELERKGSSEPSQAYKEGKFPFRIEVYDGNENKIIIDQFNCTDESIPDYYWTWVEFRPTVSADYLEPYKPYTGSDGKTFRLNDIANTEKYEPSKSGYYTVYINEYTYETDLNEGGNNWVDYVNKPNRMCWLQTQNALSNDQESIHIVSKYCFTQQSIQSFYDMPDDRNKEMDAIGMEHTNEVWGLDLRWDNVCWDWWGQHTYMTMNNGRHNTVLYWTEHTHQDNWAYYMDQTKLQRISNINENTYQKGTILGLKEGPYYVPAVAMNRHDNSDDRAYNINTVNYITIMNACMNRNRDNNGNGRLDLDEIRWYVPASSEIVDLVLGRRSLEDALMDYDANPALNTPANSPKNPKHHVNTRFHYATSNNRKLWAEEGVTVTSVHNTRDWDMPPWDVRCVRALGTDLSTDNQNDLSPAFTVDNQDSPTKIFPTYYEGKNKRAFTASILKPHQETSDLNRVCETGFEFTPQLFGTLNYHLNQWNRWTSFADFEYHYDFAKVSSRVTHDQLMDEGNTICQNYGKSKNQTGWRLPNIMEAALIKLALNNAGIFDQNLGQYDVNNPPYMAYNFISATYREYGVNEGNETRNNQTGFYLGVVYDDQDKNQSGNIIGRVQCLTEFNSNANPPGPYYYVRCVRDIRE
ncbi:MAG: hypothetical protein J1E95_06890 [Muribaculaceae bacterium]|nr:hypothetical protein [Muribaculaceae bacterium]